VSYAALAPEKPENTGKKAARSAIRTTVDQIKLCDSWLANQLVEAVRLLIVKTYENRNVKESCSAFLRGP
jgi:hypothetical protein